jgi:oxygen-dependent protoporphyrinogen oxidase
VRRAETAVVVGGGAAGLAAALVLRDAGVETTLLEASEKPGGKLGTLREAGFLLETSAIGLLDREGELQPLCRRLGLELLPAREGAKERWVLRDGRVHALPGSLPALIGTRLLSLGEKLALAGEPFRRPRRAREAAGAASSAEAPASADESVEAFFARRLGPGGPFLASALQTGIYAGDPAQLEVGAAFPSLARLERAYGSLLRGAAREARARRQARLAMGLPARARLSSFRGGMQELTSALARELGPSVRTRAQAVWLRRAGQRFRIGLVREGEPTEIDADAVVVALPAPQAAALVQPLDAALAARLDELRAAPIALVHIGVEEALLPRPARGFGLLAPGRPVVGTLYPGALWEGRAPPGAALLSSLVGGALHPRAAALPDAELVALVRAHLEAVLGLSAAAPALLTRVVRWPQAIPQYTLGHAERVATIDRLAALHPGLALAGASLHGVSVIDCLRDGARAAHAAAGLNGGAVHS